MGLQFNSTRRYRVSGKLKEKYWRKISNGRKLDTGRLSQNCKISTLGYNI
jgi:hypothetical protein